MFHPLQRTRLTKKSPISKDRSSAATLNSESSRSAVDGVAEKSRGNRSALPRAGLSAPLRIAAHYNIAERQGTKTMRDGRDGRPRVHQRPSVSARICSACVHAQVASGPLAKHVQPVISGFPRRVRARSIRYRARAAAWRLLYLQNEAAHFREPTMHARTPSPLIVRPRRFQISRLPRSFR